MKLATLSLLGILVAQCCLSQNAAAPLPVAERDDPRTPADRQQLGAILDELRQIRQLLSLQNEFITRRTAAQAPSTPVAAEKISLALGSGWHSIGSGDAPVTVMEFADIQCPYCRRFHTDTFAELKRKYIDTGKVRFISRDLPLDFHENALNAALAVRCAGEQNKYWELRDSLILNSKDLGRQSITKYAEQAGLQMSSFTECMDSRKYKDQIDKDRDEANNLGFTGTPSFVIGQTTNNYLNGVKIVGALPYSVFEAKIREVLMPHP
jgi:protein-disulfide isomerase